MEVTTMDFVIKKAFDWYHEEGISNTNISNEEAIDLFKETEIYKSNKLEPENQWISVKDGLPEVNVPALVSNPNAMAKAFKIMILYFDGEKWRELNSDDGDVFESDEDSWFTHITHWMPLPEPPKDIEG